MIESELGPYFKCRTELFSEEACIVRERKVVIPPVFCEQLLNELHDSHVGALKI